MLAELMAMRRDAPESFYSMLKDERFSLVDILKLNVAFKQISWASGTTELSVGHIFDRDPTWFEPQLE